MALTNTIIKAENSTIKAKKAAKAVIKVIIEAETWQGYKYLGETQSVLAIPEVLCLHQTKESRVVSFGLWSFLVASSVWLTISAVSVRAVSGPFLAVSVLSWTRKAPKSGISAGA